MHVKDIAARYEALISASEPEAASPQPPAKHPPAPPEEDPDPLPSGPGTVSALTRRIEAFGADAPPPFPQDTETAPKLRPALLRDASDPNTSHVTASSSAPTASTDALRFDSVPSAARLALDKTLGVATPDPEDEAVKRERTAEFLRHEAFRRRIEEEIVDDEDDEEHEGGSSDDFTDAPNDFIPAISDGSLDDIEDAEPVSDGSMSPDPETFRRIPTALSIDSAQTSNSDAHSGDAHDSFPRQTSSNQRSFEQQHALPPSSINAAPPQHIQNMPSLPRALSFSPDIRALSPDIRVISSPVFELESPVAPLESSTPDKPTTSDASASASASPASSENNASESPGESFANRFLNPPSFKLQPLAMDAVTSSAGTATTADAPSSRRPRTPSSVRSSFAPSSQGAPLSRSSFAPSSHGAPTSLPSSHATARRMHSHGFTSTPSHKKLPKAKVILARRRAEPLSHASSATGESARSPPMSRHSLDLPAARQLVREYSHPRELFAGHVSLLPSTPPESPPLSGAPGAGASVPAFRPLAQGAPALAVRPLSQPGGAAANANAKAVRNRYDDFMDPDDLPGRRHRERGEGVATEDGFPVASHSKKRYNNKKNWFGGSDEKEKERRRHERIERSTSAISGALDRVSMAADPWIDFITDANGVGIPNKTGGPLRRAMKKLFGRRGPTLIKDVD